MYKRQDVEGAAALLICFVEEKTRGTVIDEGKVVDRIRRACEDLKAYYYESVSAQLGQPTDSQSLSNWFWGETRAAWVINRIREICLEEPESKHAILGKLLLVRGPNYIVSSDTVIDKIKRRMIVFMKDF